MTPVARQKDSAAQGGRNAFELRLDRPSSAATMRWTALAGLSAFAIAHWLVLAAVAQEPVSSGQPSTDPAIQSGSVQPPTANFSIPPQVDLTVPTGEPSIESEPSAAPLDGAVQPVPMVIDGQNPPAPLPEPTSGLPPVNADEMADNDHDELLRGPVHEAFAEQFNADPVPGMVVPQKPPEAVEEVPPELRPDGRQVEWISGYWAWDDEQDDFIWVSGIWREVPQGFRWLPGYWTEVEGGYQWVSGTWVSTQSTEINYLSEAPPETLEQGPVGNAPTVEHIWIPGSWIWSDTRYAWRPGYWSTGYSSWVWVPARYQWTPRGYYFCDGYWDYPVARRGVLFAPSYFNRRFRYRQISRFTPRVVVASNLLTVHFWVRPRYRHYYFGNYYDVAWNHRGLTPWHQFPRQRRCFDPLYAYYGRGRNNDYFNQLNVQFNVFVNQPDRRPPVHFRDQDRWFQDHRELRSHELLGDRFQNFVNGSSPDRNGFRFVRLENQQRERVQEETIRLRELVNQRRDVERSLAQLERIQARSEEGIQDDKDSSELLKSPRGGIQRPDRDRGSDSHERNLEERTEHAVRRPDKNQPDRENPLVTDNQDPDRRGRDRLNLDESVRNESGRREGNGQDQPDTQLGDRSSRGDLVDRPQVVDSIDAADRDKPSDSVTREPRRRGPREGLSLEIPKAREASDPGFSGAEKTPDQLDEKTASEVGIPIIAGESNAKSEPVKEQRRNSRDRLQLPPAGNVIDNAEPLGGRARRNNAGDAIPPDKEIFFGRKPESEKNPDHGVEGSNGNSAPAVNRKDYNHSKDINSVDPNGLHGRDTELQTDGPTLKSPGLKNESGRSVRENSARSGPTDRGTILNPLVRDASGSGDVTRGSDNRVESAPKLRNSGPSRRTADESSPESTARTLSPSRNDSASGVGPGASPDTLPPAAKERPSRRETTPKIDNPVPRNRGSEALRNPEREGGALGKRGNVPGSTAREPRNAPSISIPRGDDIGTRRLNPGRPEAGRTDTNRVPRGETRTPRIDSRSENRPSNSARNAGSNAPAGNGAATEGRRGARDKNK